MRALEGNQMTKKLVNRGMGGFLNPPTHPEHEWSVIEIERNREVGSMMLTLAAEQSFQPAVDKLAAWVAPPLDSSEVQDWISQVLGYFKGCYKGQGEDGWNCTKLRIHQKPDPMLNIDTHAGVHLIRKYYPEFTPTKEHFEKSYWGTKKV
jgi:hypothetical protein